MSLAPIPHRGVAPAYYMLRLQRNVRFQRAKEPRRLQSFNPNEEHAIVCDTDKPAARAQHRYAESASRKKLFFRPLCPLRPFIHNVLILHTCFVNQFPLVSQNSVSLSAFNAAKNGTNLPI
jgi:hypothetical protein